MKTNVNFNELISKFCCLESRELLAEQKLESEYPRDATIFKEGQDSNYIHIIKSGNIKIISKYLDSVRLIRLASKDCIIGHRGINVQGTYSVSAVSLSNSALVSYPKRVFEQILKSNPQFCFQVMLFFADELRRSEDHMKIYSTMPAQNRVAGTVLMNALTLGWDENSTGSLNQTLSRKDMASYALTESETVSRKLKDLIESNVIKLENKSISILDFEELKRRSLQF